MSRFVFPRQVYRSKVHPVPRRPLTWMTLQRFSAPTRPSRALARGMRAYLFRQRERTPWRRRPIRLFFASAVQSVTGDMWVNPTYGGRTEVFPKYSGELKSNAEVR